MVMRNSRARGGEWSQVSDLLRSTAAAYATGPSWPGLPTTSTRREGTRIDGVRRVVVGHSFWVRLQGARGTIASSRTRFGD